jgi:hypothetical protein
MNTITRERLREIATWAEIQWAKGSAPRSVLSTDIADAIHAELERQAPRNECITVDDARAAQWCRIDRRATQLVAGFIGAREQWSWRQAFECAIEGESELARRVEARERA